VDSLPRGATLWSYRIAEPIPVYTMVVGIAKFAVTNLPDAACDVRCVPLAVWTYPADSAYAVDGPFRRAGQMLEVFSSLIGPFPYERLSHVEAGLSFVGGMENASAIFYDDSMYWDRDLSESIVAHETAHQWFGDAVTEDDWHHVWLSEGFATYFAVLWAEHVGGDSARVAAMRRAANQVFDSPVTDRPILDFEVRDIDSLLSTNSYEKGAWALNSLRAVVGDSAFFQGIRAYYHRYRDSTVLSADFARVMEQASGKDLDWYFAQALAQAGYPQLEITWRAEKRKRLSLDIKQVQPEAWGVYRLPALMLVIDGKRVSVDVAGRETQLVLEDIRSKPKHIEVDPDAWWLLKTTVRGEK
jgi:aminopeptidase N